MRASDFSTIALSTKRLTLRPFQLDDAEDITLLCNNINVARMTSRIPHPYALENAKEFIQMTRDWGLQSEALVFAILRKADQQIMGAMGVHQQNPGEFELGYWLGEPFWGKGYTTEAARAVISCVVKVIKPKKLSACYALDNPISGRVLEKIGFVQEPKICNVYFKARGVETPCQFMKYPLHKGFFKRILEKYQRAS